uniref:Ig-like domain-containing protein n=1 Tax=Branchiostoma floridae TaxID=7739 RepID=C3YXP2_BRAFL|eukprot:XP_002598839.1 hypothetical protein BRAFLDRAFT_74484 [Branchiostoma floridae]
MMHNCAVLTAGSSAHLHTSLVSVLYERRHSIVGDASQGEYNLHIRGAQVEDSGDYRCSTPSVRAAADVTLTVVVPMVGPPDITGAELPLTAGDELLLRCRSRGGFPPPRLTWYNGTHRFGSEDTAGDDEGGSVTLELFTARVSKWDDGANFTCVADQGFPDIVRPRAASRILRVDYPPTVSVPSPSVHAREGQAVNLTCYVDSNPKATVTWRKLGDRLPRDSIQRERSLQIVKVSKYDSGVYQCEADNRILPVGVGSIRLEVFYPPSIDSTLSDKASVMYGHNDFSLNCFADGNPKPNIRWRRKDTTLYWENPLRFHRVRYDVEGTYQCVATSDGFPVVTKEVEIDVLGKPQVEAASPQVSTNQGDVARFYCDVIGDPLPEKVTWLWRNKNGVESVLLETNNGISITEKIVGKMKTATLSIDHVTGDDEGIYICKAANIFSSDQREIRLTVKGLAHSNTLPPYSTVERQRPDGQDPRLSACIQEEDSIPVVVQVEPPAPPPKDKKRRWKRRGGDSASHGHQPGVNSASHGHQQGGTSGVRNHHQADNVLNEIQAESL